MLRQYVKEIVDESFIGRLLCKFGIHRRFRPFMSSDEDCYRCGITLSKKHTFKSRAETEDVGEYPLRLDETNAMLEEVWRKRKK